MTFSIFQTKIILSNLGTDFNNVSEILKSGNALPVEGEEQEVGGDGEQGHHLGGESCCQKSGDGMLLTRDCVKLERRQDHVRNLGPKL